MTDTQSNDVKLELDELDKKIIRQIEYYFGDINLPKDKFLKAETLKDDGWVSIDTLLTFNRLKQLTTNADQIVSSVLKSKNGLVEISESKDKMRRNPNKPLPELTEDYKNALNERTLHLKGFPLDSKFDDLFSWCKGYGAVESLEMRLKFKTKKFKGCVFVVFAKKEDADKLMAGEELKYKESPLMRENKNVYFKRKEEFNAKRKNTRIKDENKNDIKSEIKEETNGDKDVESKQEEEGDDEGKEIEKVNVKKEKEEDGESDEETELDANPVRTEGAILKLIGMEKDTKFHLIKDTLSAFAKVDYVENVNEQMESFVRFGERNGAKTVLEKAKLEGGDDESVTKVDIGGKQIVVQVLDGEDEKNYWIRYNQIRKDSFGNKKRKGYHGSKRGGKRGHFKKFRRN